MSVFDEVIAAFDTVETAGTPGERLVAQKQLGRTRSPGSSN
jgi:hypothetical protein